MQLFLYLGPEEFRKRETMADILRQHNFTPQDLQSYHASAVNLDELQNLLLSPPLFGEMPPVLLTDIDLLKTKEQKRLAELCAMCRKIPGPSPLFFLFSNEYKISAALSKLFPKSEQKIFWELSEEEKKKHLVAFCRKHDREIENSAIDILLERVSNSVVTLERTLLPVFLYLGENPAPISEELLRQIFSHSREATVYDLFHHMVGRDLGRSLLAADSLLLLGSGKAASSIMQLLYQWDKLLQIKERMRFDSFEDVCQGEYVRTKALKQDLRRGVDHYNLLELRQIQKISHDYNLNIKLGGGLQDLLFKHYIYEVVSISAL